MNCREATDFLTDYLAGDLAAALAADFDRHLAECANCLTFLTQFKDCIQAGRLAYTGPGAPADCHLPEELVQAILVVVRRAAR